MSGAAEPSDEALMARVAAQDEAAFRLLAQRHLGRIARLAEKICGSTADADEVAQETLIRIWRSADRFDPRRAKATTWMHRITYNLSIDRVRRPQARPLEEAASVADPAPSALDGVARANDVRRLRAAIDRLPRRQRAAIVLFYYEEMRGEDAAEILGLSLRAFWSLLHRARMTVQHDMDLGDAQKERIDS